MLMDLSPWWLLGALVAGPAWGLSLSEGAPWWIKSLAMTGGVILGLVFWPLMVMAMLVELVGRRSTNRFVQDLCNAMVGRRLQ